MGKEAVELLQYEIFNQCYILRARDTDPYMDTTCMGPIVNPYT
jgi:hypothetical protein